MTRQQESAAASSSAGDPPDVIAQILRLVDEGQLDATPAERAYLAGAHRILTESPHSE